MKKLFSLTVVLLLAMIILTVPSMAAGENDGGAYGYLSYLSMTEADYVSRHEAERPAFDYLEEHGVLESVDRGSPRTKMIAYDSLDALFMALQTGEINAMDVPSCTARYMCAVNDQVKQAVLHHPEKAAEHTEEENAIMSALRRSFPFEEYACRDMPEGAIVTLPYYTDLNVLVVRK